MIELLKTFGLFEYFLHFIGRDAWVYLDPFNSDFTLWKKMPTQKDLSETALSKFSHYLELLQVPSVIKGTYLLQLETHLLWVEQ